MRSIRSIPQPLLAAALVALTALPALAQGPKAVVEGPIFDAGKVARGEEIRHDFVIHNRGTAALELTEVKPTCGCTVAEYDAKIAPGASGRVRAVLDTGSFSGGIAKSVIVFTNDPASPKLNLVVKALIEQHVVVRPGYARFVTVQGKPAAAAVQTVSAEGHDGFAVTGVESPYPFVAASFAPDEAAPGRWRVELRLDPNGPAGPLADYAVIRTNHPDAPRVELPVSGLIKPILSVAPRVADFGRRDLSEPQLKSLDVRNLGDEAIELTAATSDVAGIEAAIEPVEAGKLYRIRLTLNPGLPPGEFDGTLTIRTDSRRQPVLSIPVRGRVL